MSLPKNYVLCPSCFDERGGEEKCCSHGHEPGACVACGKTRTEFEAPWHCLGSWDTYNADKGRVT